MDYLIKWIVNDDQPFIAVESQDICRLFSLLNPIAITPSADIIRNGIIEKFNHERTQARDILQVCIQFDCFIIL